MPTLVIAANPPLAPSCSLPWGGTIQSGFSTLAFQASSVPFNQECVSETRTCNSGVLSGSYQYGNCVIQDPPPCSTPWGTTVPIGSSTTAYQSPSDCSTTEQRSCVEDPTSNNVLLTGSYQYGSCTPNVCSVKTTNAGSPIYASINMATGTATLYGGLPPVTMPACSTSLYCESTKTFTLGGVPYMYTTGTKQYIGAKSTQTQDSKNPQHQANKTEANMASSFFTQNQ